MKNTLQNLRYDFPASIVVFFVALPLCLGIALASGAPLFAGIIAGIVGGIVVGTASGSQLGVSGPAAGLAVIVFGYVAALGSWESFLVAIILAGILQIIMGYFKLGNIAYHVPNPIINGMLSGIGIIIIIKQIPHVVGYDVDVARDFKEFLGDDILSYLKTSLQNFTPSVIIISAISLAIIVSWETFLIKKHKIFSVLQSPVVVVVVGIILSNFLDLHDHQIVQIPIATTASEFFSQFSLPNFDELKNPEIYAMAAVIAVIASIETLLCLEATDKLDPQKRISSANRELKAQGLGNMVSGFIGGMPVTQVIARSGANVSFGARTKTSAILHGFLLLISAIAIPGILNMIPLASLAAVLIFIGFKLAKPAIFKKSYAAGWQDFGPFMATILGMVFFDLLKGVIIGLVVAGIYYVKKTSIMNTLTKEDRDSMTPEKAIEMLKEGNERFVGNLKANRNLLKQINETSEGQHPFAFVLSCIDSRTSAELIFDQGLGDIFSCRIAGNILNDDIIGSMEFASKVAGVKLITVLGHSGCGAIKGACDNVKMGKLTSLLEKISPAIDLAKQVPNHGHSDPHPNPDKVAAMNVQIVLEQITKQSPIIAEMHKKGEIAIIGGMYNVATGVVKFY